MTVERPTALIADDEPLLRDALERLLALIKGGHRALLPMWS